VHQLVRPLISWATYLERVPSGFP